MIYAAKVNGKGQTQGTWKVAPQYTRVDGTDAPEIEAFSLNGLEPEDGDTVICAEGINDFSQSMQMIFNDNGGAFPLIIASVEQALTFALDSVKLKGDAEIDGDAQIGGDAQIDGDGQIDGDAKIKGNATLGNGGKKMLLGDTVQTWAQSVDAALQALYTWGATGVAPGLTGGINPFLQSPALQSWPTDALSAKHELD